MNKLVCGADVCKDSIVCCFLSSVPENRQVNKKNKELKFYKFEADLKSAQEFLKHKPTHIVLEPTGTHYAWIWAELCTQNDIKVLWVPNHRVSGARYHYEIKGKSDEADALALAIVGLQEENIPKTFINFNHRDGLSPLRELVLYHESINRAKSPVVNRLRQQLAREFPEAALADTDEGPDGLCPLWAWLAGMERNLQRDVDTYGDLWEESLSKWLGLEISSFTKHMAAMVQNFLLEQNRIEAAMKEELSKPVFAQYKQALRPFSLGVKIEALIVALCFPIERFFKDDGYRQARGRFKQRLGLGKVEDSSGDKKGKKASGSALARKLLFVHVVNNYTHKKTYCTTKQQDLVLSYYKSLVDRWNTDPRAIAERERQQAIKKAKAALDKQFKGIIDYQILTDMKAAIERSISVESYLPKEGEDTQKKWKKLAIQRTAARMTELIWQSLMDQIYPKK